MDLRRRLSFSVLGGWETRRRLLEVQRPPRVVHLLPRTQVPCDALSPVKAVVRILALRLQVIRRCVRYNQPAIAA